MVSSHNPDKDIRNTSKITKRTADYFNVQRLELDPLELSIVFSLFFYSCPTRVYSVFDNSRKTNNCRLTTQHNATQRSCSFMQRQQVIERAIFFCLRELWAFWHLSHLSRNVFKKTVGHCGRYSQPHRHMSRDEGEHIRALERRETIRDSLRFA